MDNEGQQSRIRASVFGVKSATMGSIPISSLKTDMEIYFDRYFLNTTFKIVHISIDNTEESGYNKLETFMVYIIKVMTQDYCYQIKRRYSEFLALYEEVKVLTGGKEIEGFGQVEKFQKKCEKSEYVFPVKKISSSLLNFLNIISKQKLADERKSVLNDFLNQINNNYLKFPSKFTLHYIQLLKFIDLKEQHQKFRKQKESHNPDFPKFSTKQSMRKKSLKLNESQPINMDYLTQLLQHQMNKINLAVKTKSLSTSSVVSQESYREITDAQNTDEIIKNVDCIRQIVLELKRKINYDHIRCIMKGKDLKIKKSVCDMLQPFPAQSSIKKGIIEFGLRYTSNQLVVIHILKVILNVFLNSQSNYSSEAFLKILSEIDPVCFTLNQQNEKLAVESQQFREIYFKMIKKYLQVKEQFSSQKKCGSEDISLKKMMGLELKDTYCKWHEQYEKNRQFRLKDDQKEWVIVIQNMPIKYPQNKQNLYNNPLTKQQGSLSKNTEKEEKPLKQYKSQTLNSVLKTSISQNAYQYTITSIVKNMCYKQCIQRIKSQRNWNPLIIDSQLDIYTNTKKDLIKIPGKQEKMFRFLEEEQIQMDLESEEEEKCEDYDIYDDFIAFDNDQQEEEKINGGDPKTSIQTMPSASGSCAYQHQPEHENGGSSNTLESTTQSRKISYIKSPPKQGSFNSYHQSVKVQRVKTQVNKPQICKIEIQMRFTQAISMKYFYTQVSGETQYIWLNFIKLFSHHDPRLQLFD